MILSKDKRVAYVSVLSRASDLKLYGAPVLVTIMANDGWEEILSCRYTAADVAKAAAELKQAGFVEQVAT